MTPASVVFLEISENDEVKRTHWLSVDAQINKVLKVRAFVHKSH